MTVSSKFLKWIKYSTITLDVFLVGIFPLILSILANLILLQDAFGWETSLTYPTILTGDFAIWYVPAEVVLQTILGILGASLIAVCNVVIIISGLLAWWGVKYTDIVLALMTTLVGFMEIGALLVMISVSSESLINHLLARILFVVVLGGMNAIWLLGQFSSRNVANNNILQTT
jgi:hypothetical protein